MRESKFRNVKALAGFHAEAEDSAVQRAWLPSHALSDSVPHVFQARGSHSLILDQSQTYFVYNANSLVSPTPFLPGSGAQQSE